MANPYGTFPDAHIKGAHLRGYFANGQRDDSTSMYVHASSVTLHKEFSSEVFTVATRRSKVVALGVEHGHEGDISGLLLVDDIWARSPYDWAWRLRELLRNQDKYERIELITRDIWFRQIIMHEGYDIEPMLNPEPMFTVRIPFVQVFDDDDEDS